MYLAGKKLVNAKGEDKGRYGYMKREGGKQKEKR